MADHGSGGGDVVGFGARRLYDDDQGLNYLNTPETPLYKKSHVLYGIDLARDISGSRRSSSRGTPTSWRATSQGHHCDRHLRHRVR